jgi:hypothetical protein
LALPIGYRPAVDREVLLYLGAYSIAGTGIASLYIDSGGNLAIGSMSGPGAYPATITVGIDLIFDTV